MQLLLSRCEALVLSSALPLLTVGHNLVTLGTRNLNHINRPRTQLVQSPFDFTSYLLEEPRETSERTLNRGTQPLPIGQLTSDLLSLV